MKFLGWMHRKLTHNNMEKGKMSTLGNPIKVQTLPGTPNKCLHPNIERQKSPNRFEANKDMVLFQETFEPFDFLTIGTFGMELQNTDPPTPTFPMPFEDFNHLEMTENELKKINYELEKFIEAEEKENIVSERSSQASIITLRGKPLENTDYEDHAYVAASPLQDNLFATPFGLEDSDKEVKKAKITLEDLFKRTNLINDDTTGTCKGVEKPPKQRIIAHFMKKVVKKFQPSSSSSTAPPKNHVAASISIKKKLSKAIKRFKNKVHPEEMAEKQFCRLKRERKYTSHENADHLKDKTEDEQMARMKINKNSGQLSSNCMCKDPPTMNVGHWIKTDSEYLVLEL